MHYFMMKALTHDNVWYKFSMLDVPTTFNEDEFVLLNKPGSPIMQLKSIKRGDPETGLFEGDIITMEGCEWVICYERGFYAINADYVTRHLYQLSDYKITGDYFTDGFPVSINTRNKHLFKYKNIIFRIEDIIGSYKTGTIILRTCKHPVPISDIKQESCMSFNNKRLFLGDYIQGKPVELIGGRIAVRNLDGVLDVSTGGNLNGYLSRVTG